MSIDDLSRRTFLARIGVLGASAVVLPQCAGPEATGAVASELSLGAIVALLRPVLAQLSRDTLNGFVAFIVPGQDPYSSAQGTPRGEPGGIEAGGTDFFIANLDRFLPLPDDIIRPATSALVTALHDLPLPIDGGLLGLLGGILGPPTVTIGLVDDAVRFIIQNDSAAPLSLPVALLLNYVATVVSPLSLHGAFISPFARLSFAQKAHALEQLETSQSPAGRADRRAGPAAAQGVGVRAAQVPGRRAPRVRRVRQLRREPALRPGHAQPGRQAGRLATHRLLAGQPDRRRLGRPDRLLPGSHGGDRCVMSS